MTDLLPYQLLPTAWLIGWTLVHFLWQATLIAAVASFVLALVDNRGSSARYLVCALSLAAMAAAPVITFVLLASTPAVDVPSLALTTLVIAPDLRQRIELLVPGITLLWVAGVWVMQVRIAAQLIGARGLARTGTQPLAEPQAGMVRSLCTQLRLPRAVKAYQSTRAAVPMVVGWLRPVVLVPTAALAGLSTAQLRAVLAHELAHIKRHDALVNLAQSVFESLFFFHPAVWWLSNRLREEREFCCDDIAVATCGDPLTYAKALAALDDARSATPANALAATALSATGGSLMQRITRLLDSGARTRRARGWIAPMIMTLSLTAVVSAMSLTVDDEPDPADALKGVDLVKVVAPVDAELGEILFILRKGGMDDATLLEFVTRMGTKPEVVDAIQGATEKAMLRAKHVAIKERMSEAHGVIKHDIEAGLITKEEATLRMEALHREMEREVAELGPPPGNTFQLRRKGPELARIDKSAAGLEKVEALKHKLHYLHEELAAGRKTAEEVEPAMQKIQKHLHELQALKGHLLELEVRPELDGTNRGVVLDIHPRLLELHPDHDAELPSGTYHLRQHESAEHDGVWSTSPVWVNEPELIEEIALEPLEPLEAGTLWQTVWTTEPPHGVVHDHDHDHALEHDHALDHDLDHVTSAENVWITGLHESAEKALHDHFQLMGEHQVVRETGPEPHEHLNKIYTVLRQMHADLLPEREVALQPLRTNVLIEMAVEPEDSWVEEPVEAQVEWVEEVEPSAEEPKEWIEEVAAADET